MATFTIAVPQELKEKLEQHPDINWAQYLKQRFEARIGELDRFQQLKNKGKV